MLYVCNLSYGIGSWAASKVAVQRYGVENVLLLFADVKYEDEDTYLWGEAAAKNIGAQLIVITEGRTPWEVFRDERFLGNSRADPCSKILKRQTLDAWRAMHCDPTETTVVVGIHWSERDRFARWDKKRQEYAGVRYRLEALGWHSIAPLCEPPFLAYDELHAWAKREGLWEQRLYQLGFPHANCGGRCVKQGQAGWALLLKTMPERYRECEREEQGMRDFLDKDVSMLTEQLDGKRYPLTLVTLRERLEAGGEYDPFDFGACSCFSGTEDDEVIPDILRPHGS